MSKFDKEKFIVDTVIHLAESGLTRDEVTELVLDVRERLGEEMGEEWVEQ